MVSNLRATQDGRHWIAKRRRYTTFFEFASRPIVTAPAKLPLGELPQRLSDEAYFAVTARPTSRIAAVSSTRSLELNRSFRQALWMTIFALPTPTAP